MTVDLIGKDLLLANSISKIKDKWVPGIYVYIYIYMDM